MGAYYNPPWIEKSAESIGAIGNDTFDCGVAFNAALAAGFSIVLSANSIYRTSIAIKPKFTGQIIRGLDSSTSVIHQATSTEHGVWVDSPFATGTIHQSGIASFVGLSNLTIRGPGTYNATTGAFSGSTGYGFAAMNAGGTYAGDGLTLNNVHVEGFDRAYHINGYAFCGFTDIYAEYNNHGLCVSVTAAGSAGATGNSFDVRGLTTSNNAGTHLWWGTGQGNRVKLNDLGMSDVYAGTPIIISASQVEIEGGNFEGMGTANKLVSIVLGSAVSMSDAVFVKGASANDGSPVQVATSGTFVHRNLRNGFTAAAIAALADACHIFGFSPGITLSNSTRTYYATTVESVLSSGIPTAVTSDVGRFRMVIDVTGTNPDYPIVCIRNSDGSTFSQLNLNPTVAKTYVGSQTIGPNLALILGGGNGGSSGSLQNAIHFNSTVGNANSRDWNLRTADITDTGELSLRVSSTNGGACNVQVLILDANGTCNWYNDITTATIGKTLKIKSGTNAKAGTFTLVAGTVAVANTGITANSVISCSLKTSGGTPGIYSPQIILNAGVGFTANGLATDTSTYNFVVLEVA